MTIINLPGIVPSLADLASSVPIGVSILGTPVYDDITFPPGTYFNSDSIPVTYLGLALQSFRVTVTGQKNIVETPVSGRSGTVDEYVNQQDYMIAIDGKITEFFDVFPADQLDNWRRIWESPESIPVISRFLNEVWGITEVIVKRFTVSPVVGSRNEVDIRIQLKSSIGFDINDFLFQNK